MRVGLICGANIVAKEGGFVIIIVDESTGLISMIVAEGGGCSRRGGGCYRVVAVAWSRSLYSPSSSTHP